MTWQLTGNASGYPGRVFVVRHRSGPSLGEPLIPPSSVHQLNDRTGFHLVRALHRKKLNHTASPSLNGKSITCAVRINTAINWFANIICSQEGWSWGVVDEEAKNRNEIERVSTYRWRFTALAVLPRLKKKSMVSDFFSQQSGMDVFGWWVSLLLLPQSL